MDMVTCSRAREASGIGPCPICGATAVSRLLEAPDRFHLRTHMYTLARCSACTCVWLVNKPEPKEMAFHYDQDYHDAIVAAGEGSADQRWNEQRQVISRYKPGGTILDIGCSSGAFLSTLTPGEWRLYGIEAERSTAEKASAATGAEIFVGDAVEAPFSPETFDVITCFDVIEHMDSPPRLVSKIFEWLTPGGIVYMALPNIDSWEARLFSTHWYGLELPRHFFHFSPRSLRKLMCQHGFDELQLRTPSTTYVERSTGYLCSTVLQRLGFEPTPQATPKQRSVPCRAFRKAIRIAMVKPLGQIAAYACAGASIEAIFSKPVRPS
jgi:SAM-dependent methyltransferase